MCGALPNYVKERNEECFEVDDTTTKLLNFRIITCSRYYESSSQQFQSLLHVLGGSVLVVEVHFS